MTEPAREGPDITTWSALLAHWTEFARASVALPDEGEGGRWKRAVPHVIALQATTMALGELDRLDDAERPVALDRAEITCRDATGAIHDLWRGEPVPELVSELIDDSRVAFERAANAGVEWVVTAERVVCDHPAELVAGLRKSGFAGELFVPAPGQPVFRGAPAAFARGPAGSAPSDAQLALIAKFLGKKNVGEPERIALPRQVYRQFDFAAGGPVKDLVVPMNEDLPPGQPVLVLAIEGGESASVPLPPREAPRIGSLPVEIVGAKD
ncbi:MAG: hypothetical protein RIB60_07790 [Phycisphaerales bacterium]